MSTIVSSVPLVSFETWIGAIASSACIGCTSLVPWLFNMTFFEQQKSKKGVQTRNSRMEYLLSFSVGAILGDIFFHLIPESIESHLDELKVPTVIAHRKVGLSIVAGIFMFIIVEMILERWSKQEVLGETIDMQVDLKRTSGGRSFSAKNIDLIETSDMENNNNDNNNNDSTNCLQCSTDFQTNGKLSKTPCSMDDIKSMTHRKSSTKSSEPKSDRVNTKTLIEPSLDKLGRKPSTTSLRAGQAIDPAGYLSLIANGIDNFTHGLAIGASFLVGPKVGLLTTFVIFIHEIPHEICDYAILVNSGFSRWDAVKAQSSVSLFGIMGTATALYFKSIDSLNANTIWILPFSAGGFLHIALVNLLPEILSRQTNFRDSIEQIACVILGVAFMGAVALS